ncbi:MAG: fused MFS/spermidine synthase [bacterium]|nr:fused MFS/spermidine synthase [bacterium]
MTKSRTWFLRLFVFGTGFVVLVLELTASRLIAPYFGTSIFVWANIIGLVLIALALGYWFGGTLADRRPELRLLMRITLLAGLLVGMIPFLFQLIGPIAIFGLQNLSVSLIAGSFFVLVILFFVPMLLLGMVSPFAVRLLNDKVETTGRSSGSLYAWSTVGSILGTFTTAFLAVPLLGTRETIYASAIVLILLGAAGLRRTNAWVFLAIPLAFWGILMASDWVNGSQYTIFREGVIWEEESPYQFIQVVERPDGERWLLTNEGYGIQSIYKESGILTGHYYDMFLLLPPLIEPVDGTIDVLFVGVAGGTIGYEMHQVYADDVPMRFDGVEIDPVLADVGERFFYLDRYPIDLTIGDGRGYLKMAEKKYDIIVVDAYGHNNSVPFHLATAEFFELAKSRLEENGMVGLNLVADRPDQPLMKNLLTTLRSVFSEVGHTTVAENDYNHFVVAANRSVKFEDAVMPPIAKELQKHAVKNITPAAADCEIFTDNHAPVELLTDLMYFRQALD